MVATTSTRIGFVGLGHMGGNMAARFLAAGYPVYGEERNRAHAQTLIDDGKALSQSLMDGRSSSAEVAGPPSP